MGKKNRPADGRKDAAGAAAASAKQPHAASGNGASAPALEAAPQHDVVRVTGQDASGAPRDELLITVLLPGVQSAFRASAGRGAAPLVAHACPLRQARPTCATWSSAPSASLCASPARCAALCHTTARALRLPTLVAASQFRLELPLDTLVEETPLSVRLFKSTEKLQILLAVQQHGASGRAASSPLASSLPERRPADFGAQPASPSASAVHAEAEALAREAMSAVQAEDLALAQQLMAKAAQLLPAEYSEALELIEAAQRSVGEEADAPVEPEPAAAAASEAGASVPRAAGASVPRAASPPESGAGGGGSARKAHKNKHRARAAEAAAAPPAAAAAEPAASGTKPAAAAAAEPAASGAEEDTEALEEQVTLQMVAAAFWQLWTERLVENRPLVLETVGWPGGEEAVRGALAPESPSRSWMLGSATAVVLLAVMLGLAVVLLISRRVLSLIASILVFCRQLVMTILRGVAWEPVWYIAFPACVVIGVQTRWPLLTMFWTAPAWWWLLGGRMWALLGSALCLGSLLLLGRANYFLSAVAWALLRGACSFSSLWLRIPACIVVFAAWACSFMLWLYALAHADLNTPVPPGELPIDVPKDADGEVARILGCRTYYAVLELDETADEEAVRKAHRRKGACTCP